MPGQADGRIVDILGGVKVVLAGSPDDFELDRVRHRPDLVDGEGVKHRRLALEQGVGRGVVEHLLDQLDILHLFRAQQALAEHLMEKKND